MKAMILAAGKGERMRPLTLRTPKPLLEVGERPLIDYHVRKLADAGITDLVINTAWLGEQIEASLGDGSHYGVRIQYSREGTPLETAGGIRHALHLLTEQGEECFMVINGDIWTDFDPGHLKAMRCDREWPAAIVLVDNPVHHPEGDFVLDADGIVHNRGEHKALTFAGISLLHSSLISSAAERENRLGALLAALADQGRLRGIHHQGAWFDVGTPERLTQVDQYVQENASP